MITAAMAGLFVLGMLYKNYFGGIKQWIHDKVAETTAASAASATTNRWGQHTGGVVGPGTTYPWDPQGGG